MKSVLVIDDNTDIRENTAEILELAGYKTFTAENGKKGVELALKEKPDVIVCDIMMPELDGYGVLHLLRKNPQSQQIPFIFLTSHDDLQDISEAYGRQTVQGFFVKGNDQQQIREILRQILSYWDLCLHPNTRKFKYS